MKAIGYQESLPINQDNALMDIELPQPKANGHDLLVQIKAISVNPVDCKIRMRAQADAGDYKVLGWDAVGEVVATGEDVSLFQPGDQVFYAGDVTRAGSNAQYQLVDERIVGHKPKSISAPQAAALPLTSITAWELLFEHLQLTKRNTQSQDKAASDEVLLIVGAAGGVGSIMIQLAKRLTNATIIATASRPSSKQWVRELGADFVVDHTQDLVTQIKALNLPTLTHVASLNQTDRYFESYIELLAPFGKIGLIDDPKPLDIAKIKPKSLSLHWEFMFARSMFAAKDIQVQGEILNQISQLIDQGELTTTLGEHLGRINATNLKQAHRLIESGQAIGKIVLEDF
ncbi:MAG: zinc-binding alcohol dehydrogenase family protein [Vibrio sp.]